MARFDLTFFAVGTKVYYVEGDLISTSTKYDTGITITSGQAKNTSFDELMGQVVMNNRTDGAYMILVTRLNGVVSAAGSTVIVDKDGAVRANVFDTEIAPGTTNLRIEGTDETYSGINTSAGSFTGLTLTQGYTDNTIAIIVYDLTSTFPNCSKIVASATKGTCLYFIGVDPDDITVSSDAVANVVMFTKFVGSTTLEQMVQMWSEEPVGRGGELTNILVTGNFVYLWKKNRLAYITISNINTTSGARPPDEFDEVEHGCVNENCAASMGGDEIVFLTPGNRLIAIRTKVEDGSVVLFPDETFDQDIRNLLKNLDDDQSDAYVFYHTAQRLLRVQVKLNSELITLVYDNNIKAWLPPDDNQAFTALVERKSVLYGTDISKDTIYRVNFGNEDDGQKIDCVMAHGVIDAGTAIWKEVVLSGSITQDTTITVETIVDGSTPAQKTIDSANFSFVSGKSFSDVAIGDTVIAGTSTDVPLADWNGKRFGIAPVTFGERYQTVLRSDGAFTWRKYDVDVTPLSKSPSTLQ